MAREIIDLTIQAFGGGVPMFHVCGGSLPGRSGVYLYQRDDGAWQAVFPADARTIAPSRDSPNGASVDVPAAVAACFPDLVL